MKQTEDRVFMEMAFALAEKARGWTSPNPLVGAVIVNKGQIVGWGYHEEAGKSHAEIVALRRAGDKAKGATLYVTLEPCTHWGRTPPCVDTLLESKLSRVVIASVDPNPLTRGRGIVRLRQAGIDVSVGVLAEKNSRLNETYEKYITRRIPFVTVKAALSLDGKMATHLGDSKWISSPECREYSHLLRGENDAIMVGSGTILADDPLLTVRHKTWGKKKITRVIVDRNLRLSPSARIFSTVASGKIVIFTRADASEERINRLQASGAEIVRLNQPTGPKQLPEILAELGGREISSLLVEGGSRLIASFLDKKLIDKVIFFLSPKLIGGQEAPGLWSKGKGVDRIAQSLNLKSARHFSLGRDIIIEGYL